MGFVLKEIPYIPTEKENHRGQPGIFAERSIEIGQIGNALIRHARLEIGDSENLASARNQLEIIESFPTFTDPNLQGSLGIYRTRFEDLAKLYEDYQEDSQLYELIFNISPQDKVLVSRI